MKTGAHPVLPPSEARASASVTPIRPLPVVGDPEALARTRLVRRLAADRLRDLRDDGVTLAYVARMYGVEPEVMEELADTLGSGTR